MLCSQRGPASPQAAPAGGQGGPAAGRGSLAPSPLVYAPSQGQRGGASLTEEEGTGVPGRSTSGTGFWVGAVTSPSNEKPSLP